MSKMKTILCLHVCWVHISSLCIYKEKAPALSPGTAHAPAHAPAPAPVVEVEVVRVGLHDGSLSFGVWVAFS